MERYPADLVITEQNFVDSGWKAVLAAADLEGYSSMWQAFSSAARKAMEDSLPAKGKVLWLRAPSRETMLAREMPLRAGEIWTAEHRTIILRMALLSPAANDRNILRILCGQ